MLQGREEMVRVKQEAWLGCTLGPVCGFLFLGTIFLMGLKKEVALSRGLFCFSVLKRMLYVITSRERGTAVSVQWHYLFEALAFIEEEKIATCFLNKRCFRCNMRWRKVRSY